MAFHAWSFALCLAVAVSVREESMHTMDLLLESDEYLDEECTSAEKKSDESDKAADEASKKRQDAEEKVREANKAMETQNEAQSAWKAANTKLQASALEKKYKEEDNAYKVLSAKVKKEMSRQMFGLRDHPDNPEFRATRVNWWKIVKLGKTCFGGPISCRA
eukprot:g24781.t1